MDELISMGIADTSNMRDENRQLEEDSTERQDKFTVEDINKAISKIKRGNASG